MGEELKEKKLCRRQWNECIRAINVQAKVNSGEPGGEPSEHSEPIKDNPWTCYSPFRVVIEKIEELQEILQREEETINSAITCRWCKRYTVKTQNVQDRCSDEGMSTFASCVSCGYKWRESSS